MAASASNTGTPSAANSLAVSLLPMPIEPVSPITKGLWPFLTFTQHLHQRLAQGRCDLGLHTEKSLEGGHRLMHQHAQPIDDLVTTCAGILQQPGLQRI